MLMNSHPFNMLQKYSGKCLLLLDYMFVSSSVHGMENFKMRVFLSFCYFGWT